MFLFVTLPLSFASPVWSVERNICPVKMCDSFSFKEQYLFGLWAGSSVHRQVLRVL